MSIHRFGYTWSMARRGDSLTLTLDVYEQLRADILGGQLPPGERIRPSEVGKRFNVSVGVVREALTRLTEQDLAVSQHNRGFEVVTLSPERLEQLVVTRQLNECRALELSIEHGDLQWEADVVAAHHRMVNTPIYQEEDAEHSNEAFSRVHRDFHFALMAGCQNEYLLSICERLFDAGELYRRWSAPMLGARRKSAKSEHKAIMDAALARKVAEASELYAQHIATTSKMVLKRFATD